MLVMTATTRAAAGQREGQPERATYRAVFAAGEFRVLFAGMLMYVLGFEFELLGLSVLVFTQTRLAFLTALAFSMGFAPQAIGGALFTALADRLPPRLVIGTGLLARAAPGLVIGLWPALPVPVMLALVAVAAMQAPVFTAAISGLLPDVLDGDRYVLGRSVFNLTGAGAQIAGLGIGGAVLAAVPVRWLLLCRGRGAGDRGRHHPPGPAAQERPRAPRAPRPGPGNRTGHHGRQRRAAQGPDRPRPAARAMAARVVRGRGRVADRAVHRVAGPAGQRGRSAAGRDAGRDADRRPARRPVLRARHARAPSVPAGRGHGGAPARAAVPPAAAAGLPGPAGLRFRFRLPARHPAGLPRQPAGTAAGPGVRPQLDRDDGRPGPDPRGRGSAGRGRRCRGRDGGRGHGHGAGGAGAARPPHRPEPGPARLQAGGPRSFLLPNGPWCLPRLPSPAPAVAPCTL